MPISTSVFAFSVACFVTLLVTPIVRRVAVRLRWRDRPTGLAHKCREASRPQAGGVAVLISGVLALWSLELAFGGIGPRLQPLLFTIAPGALLIVGVGLIDDLRGCGAIEKLFVQVAAVSVLVSSEAILGVGEIVTWAVLPAAVTTVALAVWLVTMTNAMNLIDGIDGLAPGLSVLAGAGLTVVSILQGELGPAVVAATLTGCALGFLRSNRHPAKVYLGDSGSTLFGFLIAALGVSLISRAPSIEMVLATVLLGWVPLVDTVLAVARRVRSGVSPFRADRDHLHHRLVARGHSVRGAGRILTGIGLVAAIAAVAITQGASLLLWTGLVAVATLPLARVVLPIRVTSRVETDTASHDDTAPASEGVLPAPHNRAA